MDVKDPSIPVRVPSQRPCCLFFLSFSSVKAYKPGQTLALPEFMRMFSFILIIIIHISFLCNDILLNVDAAAQERDSGSIVVSR